MHIWSTLQFSFTIKTLVNWSWIYIAKSIHYNNVFITFIVRLFFLAYLNLGEEYYYKLKASYFIILTYNVFICAIAWKFPKFLYISVLLFGFDWFLIIINDSNCLCTNSWICLLGRIFIPHRRSRVHWGIITKTCKLNNSFLNYYIGNITYVSVTFIPQLSDLSYRLGILVIDREKKIRGWG